MQHVDQQNAMRRSPPASAFSTRPLRRYLIGLLALSALGPIGNAMAGQGCDCGSTDPQAPCSSDTISVTVPALRSGPYYPAEFTWTFRSDGKPVYCGRFANGDYWVAPRPGAVVELLGVSGNGRITVDADPVIESLGLLDGSRRYGNHDPKQNVLSSLPARFSGIVSLVAAKQRDEATDGECGTKAIVGECVDAYHVVTVLDKPPLNGGRDMIRPNITGRSKDLWRLSDFDFTRLPRVSYLKGGSRERLEQIRMRWSHSIEAFAVRNHPAGVFSEGGRAFRAHILHHDYASGMAQTYTNDLMNLFSADHALEEKLPALAAMIAFGLDIYHARYNPPPGIVRSWAAGAGQHNGQFLPAVFAAALMKDPRYADVLRQVGPNTHAENEADRGPSELRQIHRGVNGALLWGDDTKFPEREEGAYWDNLLRSQCFDGAPGKCNQSIGPRTARDPYGYIDGPPNLPASGYMNITAGAQRGLVATMFLMPQVCEIVNYRPLVEYVDRLHKVGRLTAPDPCAPPDPREDPNKCDAYRGGVGCQYYRKTWGPDPANPGQCIKNGKGRFASRHGEKLTIAYGATQVEANWERIRGTSEFCLLPPRITSVQPK